MNGTPFSPHKDLLDAAIPDSIDGRLRLLEECKSRAKAAVQASAWPDAAALYEKGLAVCTDVTATRGILYANLSFVQGKMNQWPKADQAAQEAVKNDPNYVKGWWRLGQAKAALQQYDKAVDALEKALALEPTNKALLKEMEKMKKQQASAEKTTPSESSKSTTTKATTTTTSATSSKSSAKTASAATPMEIDDDDGDTKFTKSEHVKGYQVVNGKKTTFFHNELSEEAKKLIGDIAPKKLDATAAITNTNSSNTKAEGTSAWNQAGTWEERNVTTWADETLTKQLEGCLYTLPASSPAPHAVVSVSSVSLTGHASVATVRGKKRYIYEYSATVQWTFENDSDTARGKLVFPDIDGTCCVGDPYDVTDFVVEHADDPTLRPVLNKFVLQEGLRDELHKSIDAWVGLFKETY